MKKLMLAILSAVLACTVAYAEDWNPEVNVEIVAGVAAGGTMDKTARSIEQILQQQKLVPTSITVVNKPGGGQALGLQYVKSHEGDAHYISVNSEPLLTNRISGRSEISFTDFTPLVTLFEESVAFAVRNSSPFTTMEQLVEKLKKDPASVSVAIGAALGNVNHVALALLMEKTGGDVTKVRIPIFNSIGEASTALLGGHVDVLIGVVSSIEAFVPGGQVRVLAVSAPERLGGTMTETPTLKELGYDVETASFRAVVGPPGLSAAQQEWWINTMRKVTESPGWEVELKRYFWTPSFRSSAETAAYLEAKNKELEEVYLRIGLAKK